MTANATNNRDPLRRPDKAHFGPACAGCPLAAQCTTSNTGRIITFGHHEAQLAKARTREADPA